MKKNEQFSVFNIIMFNYNIFYGDAVLA